MAAADTDPRNPHDLAVDVQTDLQKLATALAHAGANPKAVAQLTQMAQVIGNVVKALANGPVPGPPEQAAGPPQGGPPAPGPAPGPAAPGPAQAAPPPGPAHQAAHHSMQSASQALHAAMIASAAARQGR